MDNKDILKAAKMQNNVNDEYERDSSRKGLLYGMMAGVILYMVMIIIEFVVLRNPDFGKPAILLIISGVSSLFEGRKLHVKKLIISGMIELIVALFFMVLYIGACFS